jgi:hypothetical protein
MMIKIGQQQSELTNRPPELTGGEFLSFQELLRTILSFRWGFPQDNTLFTSSFQS